MKFSSEDVYLVAAILYTYTPSCLVKVSIEDGKEKFIVDIPFCDLEILQTEYHGEGLGISSVKHYGQTLSLLHRLVLSMEESHNLWINRAQIERWLAGDAEGA